MAKDDLALARERLGQVLRDRWLLEQTLGVGGMAAVYAARHRNGARAAIKLLHGPLRDDNVMKERFLREAYLANTVGHPGIVRVLDDDEDPNLGPFLIMELLEGESIDELFKRKVQLPLDRVLDMADQVLDVLAVAHDKGIIHRDLKPANLFLCRDGQVKVLDFGIARLLHDQAARLTATGMMVGTPAYMSPEQARTSGKMVDGRSDLFSLGATMFRILSGRHTHVGKLAQLIVQVATERAPKLATFAPQVPEAVCQIVDRAVEFEPDRRYSTARDMQGDVREVRAGRRPPIASVLLPPAPPIPQLDMLVPSMPVSRRSQPPPSRTTDPVAAAAEAAREEARAAARRSDAFLAPTGQPPPTFGLPPPGVTAPTGGVRPDPPALAQTPATGQSSQHQHQQQQQHAYEQQQLQHQQQLQQAYAQQQAYQQQQAHQQHLQQQYDQQQHAQQQQYAQQQQQQQQYEQQQAQQTHAGYAAAATRASERPQPPPGWQVDPQRSPSQQNFHAVSAPQSSSAPRSDPGGGQSTFKSTQYQLASADAPPSPHSNPTPPVSQRSSGQPSGKLSMPQLQPGAAHQQQQQQQQLPPTQPMMQPQGSYHHPPPMMPPPSFVAAPRAKKSGGGTLWVVLFIVFLLLAAGGTLVARHFGVLDF